MKSQQTLVLVALVLVGSYLGGYAIARVTGVLVHRWGWDFDPVGAGEPQAPAIHRVAAPMRNWREWRGLVGRASEVIWMPVRAAEAAWWHHRVPVVRADDPDYLRAR